MRGGKGINHPAPGGIEQTTSIEGHGVGRESGAEAAVSAWAGGRGGP